MDERLKAIQAFDGYANLLAVYHCWLTTGMDSRTGPMQAVYSFEDLGAFVNGGDLKIYAMHQLAAVIDAQTKQQLTWLEAIYEEIRQYSGWKRQDD